ncbi:hypothetical protein KCP74_20605 [Salmonella enterica subsp. enterica]|nr:hypothetical protein KCP74_20605 [Salmonella enterica subsp. enterica]
MHYRCSTLAQTGEIIWLQVKQTSNNNNPLTRDEIRRAIFPVSSRRRRIAGLSGGAFEHCSTISTADFVLALRHSRPRTPPTSAHFYGHHRAFILPRVSQLLAAAFYTPGYGGRISAWCGTPAYRCRRIRGLYCASFHSRVLLAYRAIATIGAVLSCCDPARRTPFCCGGSNSCKNGEPARCGSAPFAYGCPWRQYSINVRLRLIDRGVPATAILGAGAGGSMVEDERQH